MENLETAKLTRISIQNWAKENDVDLTVLTDESPSVGLVTVVLMDDLKIFYYYEYNHILVIKSENMVSIDPVSVGRKISERVIEEIEKYLN